MSRGEAPLQVGSVAIVCEEQGKVKGVCLTYPPCGNQEQGIGFPQEKCALWAVCVFVFWVLMWYRCGTGTLFKEPE